MIEDQSRKYFLSLRRLKRIPTTLLACYNKLFFFFFGNAFMFDDLLFPRNKCHGVHKDLPRIVKIQ